MNSLQKNDFFYIIGLKASFSLPILYNKDLRGNTFFRQRKKGKGSKQKTSEVFFWNFSFPGWCWVFFSHQKTERFELCFSSDTQRATLTLQHKQVHFYPESLRAAAHSSLNAPTMTLSQPSALLIQGRKQGIERLLLLSLSVPPELQIP